MNRKRKTQSWLSEEFSSVDKTEAWEEALCQSYRSWSITQSVSSSFRAQLIRHELEDISLINTFCDPCRGERNHRTVKKDDDLYIGIQLTEIGKERFHCRDLCVEVEAGDLIVWNTANATRFEVLQPLNKLTLMVPWRILRESFPLLRTPPQAGKLESRFGIGYLLVSQMRAMAKELPQLENHLVGATSRAMLELVSATLFHARRQGTDNHSIDLRMLQQYIIRNLHDENISPSAIAEVNGISLRKLHLLFQREDTSVSRFILQKRLEGCKNMLSDPTLNQLQVSEIAYSKGFRSISHFSRVFESPRLH